MIAQSVVELAKGGQEEQAVRVEAAAASVPGTLNAPAGEREELGAAVASRVGAQAFERYFGSATPMRVVEDGLEIVVSSGFLASVLERRFGAALAEVARGQTGRASARAKFVVREGATGAAGGSEPAAREAEGKSAEVARGVRAGPTAAAQAAMRFDLARLVVGKANRMAFEAALRLARDERGPGVAGSRLLYLHGPHGSGKTHLLHGATALARQRDQSAGVRAVSGEQFANEYIQAVRNKRVETFQRLYRGLDVLGIDDLCGMTGKEGTLAEFVRTLEALHTRGARVIITGPTAPRALSGMPEGLVSRLSGGMVSGIEPADGALREQFVVAQAHRRGLEMSEEAAKWIAHAEWSSGRSAGSLRELEGAVARVEAYVRVHAGSAGPTEPVSRVAAERALGISLTGGLGGAGGAGGVAGAARAFAPGVPMPIRFDRVAEVVCGELGVRFDEVLGTTRRPAVVLARSLIVYVARRTTGLSFPEIGRGLGRPGHSTAITAFQRIERQLEAGQKLDDPRLAREGTLAELSERLIGLVRKV